MSDTPKDQGEKRGVVDEEWTPRFTDKDAMDKFESDMEDIASKIPVIKPAHEEAPK